MSAADMALFDEDVELAVCVRAVSNSCRQVNAGSVRLPWNAVVWLFNMRSSQNPPARQNDLHGRWDLLKRRKPHLWRIEATVNKVGKVPAAELMASLAVAVSAIVPVVPASSPATRAAVEVAGLAVEACEKAIANAADAVDIASLAESAVVGANDEAGGDARVAAFKVACEKSLEAAAAAESAAFHVMGAFAALSANVKSEMSELKKREKEARDVAMEVLLKMATKSISSSHAARNSAAVMVALANKLSSSLASVAATSRALSSSSVTSKGATVDTLVLPTTHTASTLSPNQDAKQSSVSSLADPDTNLFKNCERSDVSRRLPQTRAKTVSAIKLTEETFSVSFDHVAGHLPSTEPGLSDYSL
jgi:hypothetical protein